MRDTPVSYSRVSRLALHSARAKLIWPLLTSAMRSERLSTPSVKDNMADLPGYDALTFTLISVGFTPQRPCKYWALHLLACSPHCVACIRWLFVRAALCLQLPLDPTSRWTPLLCG